MKLSKLFFSLLGLAFALALCLPVAPAHAQATRTWVSGVGDDANPCSRTAPCKTFAGSISKTATGGEINCIDPGGFGAVTITKAITIDCSEVFGSVLVSGTNGIIINAAGAKVTLRNLDIQGLGTGLTGVLVLAAADVVVDHCRIAGFTTAGIGVTAAATVTGQVVDTAISAVPTGINVTTTSGTARVAVKNAHIGVTTSASLQAGANGSISVTDSIVSNSAGSAAFASGTMYIANSHFDNNVVTFNAGAGGTIFVSNNDVLNTTTAFITTGTISSAGNNRIASGGGAPNGTAISIK